MADKQDEVTAKSLGEAKSVSAVPSKREPFCGWGSDRSHGDLCLTWKSCYCSCHHNKLRKLQLEGEKATLRRLAEKYPELTLTIAERLIRATP